MGIQGLEQRGFDKVRIWGSDFGRILVIHDGDSDDSDDDSDGSI